MRGKMQQMELGTLTRDSRAEYRRKAVAYVQQNRDEYLGKVESLCTNSAAEKVWRLVFAVLTPRERFDRSRYAYILLRLAPEELLDADTIAMALRRAGLSLVNVKCRGVRYLLDSRNLVLPEFGEDLHSYRLRLSDTVPGLGLAKATFAVCLMFPMSAPFACIDTWICRLLYGQPGMNLSARQYFVAERWIAREARKLTLPVFAMQWGLWDFIRGEKAEHSFLKENS